MSALELVTATSASNGSSPKTQAVSCPGGKKALGGGGSVAWSGNRCPGNGGQPAHRWLPANRLECHRGRGKRVC